ncbi:uncharacterized protein LOC129601175 [Paramacrobiotus metropolitanus]|uniref:uncharacterized protein LOC129601175 n=1 Tax=Paramacrobiotus metropolitanus TaxID=2943436 RepID=UPI002445A8A9|nr:uncharacterized protein LOC129601175 [Paramacrobiotus metropolitanus]
MNDTSGSSVVPTATAPPAHVANIATTLRKMDFIRNLYRCGVVGLRDDTNGLVRHGIIRDLAANGDFLVDFGVTGQNKVSVPVCQCLEWRGPCSPAPPTPGTPVLTLYCTAPDYTTYCRGVLRSLKFVPGQPWYWYPSTFLAGEDAQYACVAIHLPGGETLRTVVRPERVRRVPPVEHGDGWVPYPSERLRYWRHAVPVMDKHLMAASQQILLIQAGAAFRTAWHTATSSISVGLRPGQTGWLDLVYLSHQETPMPDTEVMSKLREVVEKFRHSPKPKPKQNQVPKRSLDVAGGTPAKKPTKAKSAALSRSSDPLVSELTPRITAEILSCLAVNQQMTCRRVCTKWNGIATAGMLTTVIIDPGKYPRAKLPYALCHTINPNTQLLLITNGTHVREFTVSFFNVVFDMLRGLQTRVPCIVVTDTKVLARDLYVDKWRNTLPWSTVCQRLVLRNVKLVLQQRQREGADDLVWLEGVLRRDYGIRDCQWKLTEHARGLFVDVLAVLRIIDGIRRFNP